MPGAVAVLAFAVAAAGAASSTSVAARLAHAAALQGTARLEQPLPLSVMTFNIRTSGSDDGDNGWPRRRALVAETIARLAPDLVGLQEALDEQVEYLADALPGYRWLGADRGLNGGTGLSEYTPLFYRRDALIPIESGTFWLAATPDGPTAGGATSPASSPGRTSTTAGPAGVCTSSTRTSRFVAASDRSTRRR